MLLKTTFNLWLSYCNYKNTKWKKKLKIFVNIEYKQWWSYLKIDQVFGFHQTRSISDHQKSKIDRAPHSCLSSTLNSCACANAMRLRFSVYHWRISHGVSLFVHRSTLLIEYKGFKRINGIFRRRVIIHKIRFVAEIWLLIDYRKSGKKIAKSFYTLFYNLHNESS